MNKKSIVPGLIKFFAVVTALPRWVIALLAADGLTIPQDWTWVHVASGFFGAGMTVLEGVAIAYVFSALAQQGKRKSLQALTVLMLVSFIGVLAPSVYSRVVLQSIGDVLPAWALWVWAVCVPSSTILTVAAVGDAQSAIDVLPVAQASQMVRNLAQHTDNRIDTLAQLVNDLQSELDLLRNEPQHEQVEIATSASEPQLNDTQAAIIAQLRRGPMQQAQLVDTIGKSASTISRNVKTLVDMGIVRSNGDVRLVV